MKRESIIMWLLTGSIMFFGCTENQVPEDEVIKTPTDSVKPDQDTTVVFPKDTTTIVPADTTDFDDSKTPDSLIVYDNDEIIISTGKNSQYVVCPDTTKGESGVLPAILYIVKFFNPRQEEKVIVQHPIAYYHDGYVYLDNGDLYLNVLLPSFNLYNPDNYYNPGMSQELVKWADEDMHISGTSPYIPLAEGYYLVDWKWKDLLPLSALALERLAMLREHLTHHVFMTGTNWKNLKNLTCGYSSSRPSTAIGGIEIIRIKPDALLCPYDYPDLSIFYWEGMSLANAYRFYKKGYYYFNGRTYKSYISYCDSVQSHYKDRLIELIKDGKIQEFGY